MARNEFDREDLFREATALVERIEFRQTHSAAEPLVVGFRADGALSVYLGSDPVYQFNAAGQLRRAFCDGQLYKAVRGRLASLRRERGENKVQLVRHDLTDAEQEAFLEQMSIRLQSFSQQLSANEWIPAGQVPVNADVAGRVKKWFADHQMIDVATQPNA
jgi:hypothetical protein